MLRVGGTYVAIGPAEGSKLGPPPQVEVVGVDENAGHYLVKGSKVSSVIVFGAEHMWREVAPETLL